MRVLLTNDDGIEAAGLQALRAALLDVDGIELAVIAPDGNRSAMARSITTRRPLWVQEVDFGDGTDGLRHRRDAGRLRAAGQPRAGRGVRGRAGRVRHQPRLEPGRRHHLLGHGGGGARGDRARAARDRRLAAVERARARLQGGDRVRLRASRRRSPPAWWRSSRPRRCPSGTLLNVNVPVPATERRRGGAAGQARLPGRALARRRGRRGTAAVQDLRRRELRARRDRHRPGRGGAGQDRGHAGPLRPDRPGGHVGARALRPRAAGGAGGRELAEHP